MKKYKSFGGKTFILLDVDGNFLATLQVEDLSITLVTVDDLTVLSPEGGVLDEERR